MREPVTLSTGQTYDRVSFFNVQPGWELHRIMKRSAAAMLLKYQSSSDLDGPKSLVAEVSQDDTKAIVLYNPRNSEESSVPAFQVSDDFFFFSKVGRFSRRYMNWGLLDPPSEYSVSMDGDNNLALVPWVPPTSVSKGSRGAETAHYENGGKLVIEDITDSLAEDQNQNDEEMEGMEVEEEAMPQSSFTGPCFSSYVNQERNNLQAFPSQNHPGFFPAQAVHQGQDNSGIFPAQNNSGIYPAQSVFQGQNNVGSFSTNPPSQGFPFGGCNFPIWQNSNIVNPVACCCVYIIYLIYFAFMLHGVKPFKFLRKHN